MNIFFLSGKTSRCARWHCDKHVVKMILEYCQMLYTAHHVHGSSANVHAEAPVCESTGKRGFQKHAANHPSTLWVCESLAHYMWLVQLGLDLCREYNHRFSPKGRHKCHAHLLWLKKNVPANMVFKRYWLRDPPPAMPDEYKVPGSSLESYWNYYNGSKRERGLLKYTNRHIPHIFL